MIAGGPDKLEAEARQLIAEGRFEEARKVVRAYCDMFADGKLDGAAIDNAREFLNWAIETASAIRSHALVSRSELNRAAAYGGMRRNLKTWEIVS
jgi:hypothetical protein